MTATFYIVFDGPPGPVPGRFIEVEDSRESGRSVRAGEWFDRGDGYWSLGPFATPFDAENARLRGALQSIMNELGVPQPGYPQPVANAYEIARAALRAFREDAS